MMSSFSPSTYIVSRFLLSSRSCIVRNSLPTLTLSSHMPTHSDRPALPSTFFAVRFALSLLASNPDVIVSPCPLFARPAPPSTFLSTASPRHLLHLSLLLPFNSPSPGFLASTFLAAALPFVFCSYIICCLCHGVIITLQTVAPGE